MPQKVAEALPVYMKFLGCGDAFGPGGRLNTCFLVNRRDASFLIDCGASAMISIRRFGVDPNGVDAIILSHLHVDATAAAGFSADSRRSHLAQTQAIPAHMPK